MSHNSHAAQPQTTKSPCYKSRHSQDQDPRTTSLCPSQKDIQRRTDVTMTWTQQCELKMNPSLKEN